jgi:hypothetical protein
MTELLPATQTLERLREMQCLARLVRRALFCLPPSPLTSSLLNSLIPPTHPLIVVTGGRDGQIG